MAANISSQLVLLQTRDKVSPHVKKLIGSISPSMIEDETFSYLHEQIKEGRSVADILTDDVVDSDKVLELSNSMTLDFLVSQDPLQIEKTVNKFIETNALRKSILQVDELAEQLEGGELTVDEIRDVFLKAISSTRKGSCYTDVDSVFLSMQTTAQKFLEDGEKSCIPTGIKNLDDALRGGIKRATFGLLGGRTGKGKSCFAMTLAYNMVAAGYKVLYNNLELTGYLEEMVLRRFIAIGSFHERVALTVSQIEYPETQKQYDLIQDLYFNVVRDKMPTLAEITNLDDLEAEIVCNNYDFIIIDYIGCLDEMSDPEVNEYTALKKVSSRLKDISHKRGASILGVMQYHKGSTHKEGERIGPVALKGNDQVRHDCDYYFNVNCKYEAKEEEYDIEWEKDRDGGLTNTDTPVKFIKNKQIFIDR